MLHELLNIANVRLAHDFNEFGRLVTQFRVCVFDETMLEPCQLRAFEAPSETSETDLIGLVALVVVDEEAAGLFLVLPVLETIVYNDSDVFSGRLLRFKLFELVGLNVDDAFSMP